MALWIILFHLTGPGQDLEAGVLRLPHALFTLIRGGYQAVTTFFALSGFVLAHSYGSRRLVGYARGRVARVYPVYLLSMAIMTPFILEDQTPGKAAYVVAYLLLVQGWMGSIPVNWNTPAWALSCEMFFYALFPLSIPLIRRATWRGVILVAAGACVLTRIMWALGVSDSIKPLVHLADFIMGIAASCAYHLLTQRARPPAGWKLYVPGIAGVALAVVYAAFLPWGIDLNSVLRPLNGLLLVGLALGGGWLARALSTGVLMYLGKCSYAIYILHVPVMWWYLRKSRHFSPALYVAIVLALSALVYSFFEEPANRLLRRRKNA